MSTNPIRREGGYWKPVLDYEHWEEEAPEASPKNAVATEPKPVADPQLRHDLCEHCGAEFVVNSPFCRMCGRAREGAFRPKKSRWDVLDFYQLRRRLGLSVGAMICFIVGIICLGAGVSTGFIYTASTLVDWQAIQIWRGEWLIAAGVAFVCGILLNSRKITHL
jgi:hypothetical protein